MGGPSAIPVSRSILAVVVMVVPVGTMMMMPAVMAVVMMPPVTMAVMVVPAIVMVAMPPMVVMMVVVTPPAPMHLLDRARSLGNAGVYGARHRCRGRGLGCRRKADEGQRGKWK